MNKLKELQKCQLEILKEIHQLCTENQLCYSLAFGSCLGAVRHKGFIPWDDDIDIYMPIEDFEKLKLCKDKFKQPYFLQTQETDAEYGLMIGRVRNSDTTLIEQSEADRNINHGIFIDIYPMFHTPKSGLKAEYLTIISMIYRLLLYKKVPQNRGMIMKLGSMILLKIFPNSMLDKTIKLLYKILKNQKETGYISSLYGDEQRIRYKKEWIFPIQQVPFEDITVPIPKEYDKYLSYTYGDYMQLPPKEKRTVHHSYQFLDTDSSYKNYKGIYYCVER